MKKSKFSYIFLAVLILAVSLMSISAIALDAGNFSGGSDYGGGGGYDWSNDYGSDYSSDYSSDYNVGDGDASGGGIGIFVAIVIIVVVISLIKKKGGAAAPEAGGSDVKTDSMRPVAMLKEKDANFSEAAIMERISNLYIQMQQAWQGKDFEPMRPHMTDRLYNQFNLQLGELVRANATNYVERIAVLGVDLMGWGEDEVNDIILATVRTRIIDYTLDDKSGELISGSKTAEKFMTYQWTLIRSMGMTTPAHEGQGSENTTSIHCPSCGAPLDVNQSAKCPYCDTVISARDYDWVISSIKGISQRTGN